MTFHRGDKVEVLFPADMGEWVSGVVMQDSGHGHVMCHIERPSSLKSLPRMAGDKPVVMVREHYVRKAQQ